MQYLVICHFARSRDRDTFYQDEYENNYNGLGRKIESHSLVDTEHQENQLALQAFSQQGTTTANLVIDKYSLPN